MISTPIDPAPVAVLCARDDSIYKSLPGCDVWDQQRDARTWPGGAAIVGHPPCRLWGRLRTFARAANPGSERALAVWCVEQVRQWGGVVEHPAQSTLWPTMGLPRPGEPPDAAGGWTLGIWQSWFGHLATKPTWLYLVGITPAQLPPPPFVLGGGSHTIGSSRGRARRPEVSKAAREQTPLRLAQWLVTLARLARRERRSDAFNAD